MNHPPARNDALHDALKEAGLTYEQAAAAVRVVAAEAGELLRTNKSAIAHWVSGRKKPSPRTATYLAEAVSRRLGRHLRPSDLGLCAPEQDTPHEGLGLLLGPDPVDTLRRLGEADIHRRGFLTGTAYSVAAAALPLGVEQAVEQRQRAAAAGHRAGPAEIAAVRDMVAMYTRIDERHGGRQGRSAVAQYLRSDVADLCRSSFARERDRADALSAAACVAYLAGWKAYDAGEHGLAQRYYLQAWALTKEADDDLHGAWILRIMAHNGMDIRQPAATLDLAERALDTVRGRVDPATEALFAVTRARALAHAGRGKEAVAQIRQAQDLVLHGDPEAVPFWAALWGSSRATVASHTAKTFRELRDHANAERYYATSAKARPGAGGQHQRITALTLAAQGREQSAQGHLEAACATWSTSLDLFDGVRSARAASEVRIIRGQLRVFDRRGVKAAVELDERARSWQLVHT
ncbi:Tat pathway signal protein [Streptomyces thermocarboxydovorans]|uniref:Tat pathway signal protein n=1 Tax=Streptomyces thermocarboxydovorans TaxID=59298 RepID=A0ABN1HCL3_9ACTN